MKTYPRLWEIDSLRGLAVSAMIIYHFLFDLSFFYGLNIDVFHGPLLVLARLTAITFIFLVGVSVSLRFASSVKSSLPKIIQRSLIILFWALIITLVTFLLFPREFVIFGILHLIGLSLLLLIPFLFIKNDFLIFLSGLIIIATGLLIAHGSVDSSALIWLGLKPRNFISLDYFPLLPWFGLTLLGLVFGRFYPRYRPRLTLFKKPPRFSLFSFLGRHSLSLYLLHQPIIIFLLFLLKVILGYHP